MLRYESTSRLKPSAIRAIQQDVQAIERDWWKGALGFDAAEDDEHPTTLSGRTPLFYKSGITSGIPDPDDLFMAFADATFILGLLGAWATNHKIKWHVRMHDDDWGAVDPSGMTKPLRDQMGKWARRLKIFPSGRNEWFIPEDRRAELLSRHAARKGT